MATVARADRRVAAAVLHAELQADRDALGPLQVRHAAGELRGLPWARRRPRRAQVPLVSYRYDHERRVLEWIDDGSDTAHVRSDNLYAGMLSVGYSDDPHPRRVVRQPFALPAPPPTPIPAALEIPRARLVRPSWWRCLIAWWRS